MSAIMLAMTVGLGVWQLQRLSWKRQLLTEIARGEALDPVELSDTPPAFRKVWVEGTYAPVSAWYGADVRSGAAGPVMGAQVIGALTRPGRAPVLIDEGWAPIGSAPQVPGGAVRIEGYVRLPDRPVWMGARDNLAERRFYTLDPAVIGAAFGLGAVAPFTVVALGDAAGWPRPDNVLPRPSNDHLSYAITWFALATCLLVIFGVYARQVFREASRT